MPRVTRAVPLPSLQRRSASTSIMSDGATVPSARPPPLRDRDAGHTLARSRRRRRRLVASRLAGALAVDIDLPPLLGGVSGSAGRAVEAKSSAAARTAWTGLSFPRHVFDLFRFVEWQTKAFFQTPSGSLPIHHRGFALSRGAETGLARALDVRLFGGGAVTNTTRLADMLFAYGQARRRSVSGRL